MNDRQQSADDLLGDIEKILKFPGLERFQASKLAWIALRVVACREGSATILSSPAEVAAAVGAADQRTGRDAIENLENLGVLAVSTRNLADLGKVRGRVKVTLKSPSSVPLSQPPGIVTDAQKTFGFSGRSHRRIEAHPRPRRHREKGPVAQAGPGPVAQGGPFSDPIGRSSRARARRLSSCLSVDDRQEDKYKKTALAAVAKVWPGKPWFEMRDSSLTLVVCAAIAAHAIEQPDGGQWDGSLAASWLANANESVGKARTNRLGYYRGSLINGLVEILGLCEREEARELWGDFYRWALPRARESLRQWREEESQQRAAAKADPGPPDEQPNDEPAELGPEPPIAAAIRAAVCERVGTQRYELWLGKSARLELEGDALNIGVPNDFFVQWLRANFREEIGQACETALGKRPAVTFRVDDRLPAPQTGTAGKPR
jgi:hypothetical protein